jgi:ketosteroid isomerase-like protein
MSPETLEQQVIQSLDRSAIAFSKGLSEYFDEFGEEAMIFTTDSPEPIKGREAYRQSYESALSSGKREKTVLDRSVQIVGDKAVATQTAQITQGENTVTVRQTIVYGQTGEGLKVVHSHTLLLTPNSDDVSGIRVVNEKIATVSSSLGVAQ